MMSPSMQSRHEDAAAHDARQQLISWAHCRNIGFASELSQEQQLRHWSWRPASVAESHAQLCWAQQPRGPAAVSCPGELWHCCCSCMYIDRLD